VDDVYVPTRYLSHSTLEDGTLILHNSRTGAVGSVPPDQAAVARAALRRSVRHPAPLSGLLADLVEGGFLLPLHTDEAALVDQQFLARYDDTYLNLILMPTEACNFRCVYCYESFDRGAMSPAVQQGITRFVAAQQHLQHLDINWFGGEPLLAPEVVCHLTAFFAQHCAAQGITYAARMTTNGSLLTRELADQLIPGGIRHFQITLDGLAPDHDARRVRLGGGGSFDAILANLRALHQSDHSFQVVLRHNFDPDSLPSLPDFLALLVAEFGGDPRFTTHFEPIGKWGGPNDADLSVCEGRHATQALIQAKALGIAAGFRSGIQIEQFQPNGYVCYAANPRSFVVGSDGRLYKCTVELDYHDRNIVGQLQPDGTMTLDWRKMALWCETNGLDAGKKCGSCFFRPSCHGAVCPKQWLDENDCACPHERVAIQQILPLFLQESRLPAPPTPSTAAACGRG
jgi:uncharacterized protein